MGLVVDGLQITLSLGGPSWSRRTSDVTKKGNVIVMWMIVVGNCVLKEGKCDSSVDVCCW